MIRQLAWPVIVLGLAVFAQGQQVKLLKQAHDPYGIPRPGADQKNVPLRTSFYVELGLEKADKADTIPSESVGIRLRPAGGEAFDVLTAGRLFASGYLGRFIPRNDRQGGQAVGVYASSDQPLKPSTTYTIEVSAKSKKGAVLPAKAGKWAFTTEAVPLAHELSAAVDLETAPVRWHGAFFSGFCKPFFCTSDPIMIGTYEMMKQVHQRHPKAWSLQRDFWMTGMDDKPGLLMPRLPNVVRERETRRITAIEEKPDGLLLKVEDFFGHEQYGIPSGRPVSTDYHAGDEVLIADGEHSARVKVLGADDGAKTVLVSRAAAPPGGWRLAYFAPLPRNEDPKAPGLFPWGGCYLRKFNPSGTPCYYWGRLDKEWDIAHKRFGHRLMPNIADAPGDLSIDGRNWTTAKDYVQLHEVVRMMTDHLMPASTSSGACSTSRTWAGCSGGRTGTSCRGSTTTRRMRSCGRSRTADTIPTACSLAAWNLAASSARTSRCASSWFIALREPRGTVHCRSMPRSPICGWMGNDRSGSRIFAGRTAARGHRVTSSPFTHTTARK
jgi:hypothetical protein